MMRAPSLNTPTPHLSEVGRFSHQITIAAEVVSTPVLGWTRAGTPALLFFVRQGECIRNTGHVSPARSLR
jgi:hypothetical protein